MYFFQVNYYANELWAKFLRQADIAKDDLFRSFIPKWVEVALKKAAKIGRPSEVKFRMALERILGLIK